MNLNPQEKKKIICWEKPKKIRSTEEHNALCSSDCEVNGTYVPNMSVSDRKKWKGKITGIRTTPQVEIRKDSFVIIVGLDGYNYKSYKREPDRFCGSTKGLNIHIASAGPIQLSFDQWEQFKEVVEEARNILLGGKNTIKELSH